MQIEVKIKEIIEDVVAQNGYTLDSVFLFGSRARGDFEKDSDYDILIIVKEEIPIVVKKNLRAKISAALHKEIKFVPFDIIVKSLKTFMEEREVVNTISSEVAMEGKQL
ncbi:MAG: nucleotidyltransferase domain-containing protein [Candidatus Ratteibacteria bacterium]